MATLFTINLLPFIKSYEDAISNIINILSFIHNQLILLIKIYQNPNVLHIRQVGPPRHALQQSLFT